MREGILESLANDALHRAALEPVDQPVIERASDRHAGRRLHAAIDDDGSGHDPSNEQDDRGMGARHQGCQPVIHSEVTDIRHHGRSELIVLDAEPPEIEL